MDAWRRVRRPNSLISDLLYNRSRQPQRRFTSKKNEYQSTALPHLSRLPPALAGLRYHRRHRYHWCRSSRRKRAASGRGRNSWRNPGPPAGISPISETHRRDEHRARNKRAPALAKTPLQRLGKGRVCNSIRRAETNIDRHCNAKIVRRPRILSGRAGRREDWGRDIKMLPRRTPQPEQLSSEATLPERRALHCRGFPRTTRKPTVWCLSPGRSEARKSRL